MGGEATFSSSTLLYADWIFPLITEVSSSSAGIAGTVDWDNLPDLPSGNTAFSIRVLIYDESGYLIDSEDISDITSTTCSFLCVTETSGIVEIFYTYYYTSDIS